MTDIVERLYGLADDITPELAAQEITRLRAEIAVLRADLLKAEMKGELDDIEEVARLVAIGRREGIEAAVEKAARYPEENGACRHTAAGMLDAIRALLEASHD